MVTCQAATMPVRLLALTVGLAIALPRWPRRQDSIGLAAACTPVLIALQICDGYHSLSDVLWLVPLALVALRATRCRTGSPRRTSTRRVFR
jgi:hypothetical protein